MSLLKEPPILQMAPLRSHCKIFEFAWELNSTTVTKGRGVLTVKGSVAGAGSLFGGTVDP